MTGVQLILLSKRVHGTLNHHHPVEVSYSMKCLGPAVACIGVLLSLPVFAQDVPAVRKGATEIAGFVGASYGIDEFRVMGGGNVAYAVTREIMPYAELSYFPGIGRRDTVNNTDYIYSVPLTDFHGGVHIRIPIKESKVVPYLSAGMGLVHLQSVTYTSTAIVNGQTITYKPYTFPSESKFAGNFGGGFRFYVNEKFGIRLEAKAYAAKDEAVFGKVTVGFFYQIK